LFSRVARSDSAVSADGAMRDWLSHPVLSSFPRASVGRGSKAFPAANSRASADGTAR
jgi:hypothetical protein